MEFEQITKRLEWLDDQERKSKASVSDLGKSLPRLKRRSMQFPNKSKRSRRKFQILALRPRA